MDVQRARRLMMMEFGTAMNATMIYVRNAQIDLFHA